MYETILKVDGMSCSMCEAHINDAIRGNVPVKKVTSSHRSGLVTIVAEEPIDRQALANVLDPLGYPILSLESKPHGKRKLFGGKR